MKLFSIIFLISGFCCSQFDEGMVVKYYKNGSEILINHEDAALLLTEVNELFEGVDDVAKLYLSSQRITEIKVKYSALEIIFPETVKYNLKNMGDFEIQKIFIPLSGDLIDLEHFTYCLLICGDEEYFSPPFINTIPEDQIKRILKIVNHL